MIDPCAPIRPRLSPARVREILAWNRANPTHVPPPAPCVRFPQHTVPAFIAAPPAATASTLGVKLAAAGLATVGAAGGMALMVSRTGSAPGTNGGGSALVGGFVASPALNRTLADVQIPAPVGFSDVGAVPVPEAPSLVLVAVPFVLVVLGRRFRRA